MNLFSVCNAAPSGSVPTGEPDAAKGVWAVRFEPAGDFAPKTPGEFLSKIHVYSGQSGEIGYFRTTKQGDKLVGSFLAYDAGQLKAALAKIPELKVLSAEKLTAEQLAAYEKSPQESLLDFDHLDAAKGVWAVRFEPAGDFSPKTPHEFLSKIHVYSGQSGEIGYFRTTKQGDKLIGSFLAYDGDQLKAALAKIPDLKVLSSEKLTAEQLATYEKSPQESLLDQNHADAANSAAVPKIVATSPAVGATDVDPALTEITVTFDQDMRGGMSWTGGGPNFPKGLEGQKAHWRDKRTCVLPVTLEAAHFYRVGINSKSYLNFSSEQKVPALPAAIFFATKGASAEVKAKALVPQAVHFDPPNGAQDVSPAATELRVTFSVPMGGGCSWCTVGDDDSDYPKCPAGKMFFWTSDKKTCVLPVALKPGMTYRLSLNAPEFNNFQSEAGVPLEPVIYTFKTTGKPLGSTRASDDQLATKVTLTKPYPLNFEGDESDKITVQYAVIDLAKQARLDYDFGTSQTNAGVACRKYITPTIEGVPLREALDEILKPEALTYDILDGKIVLKNN
jgi:hypothetical protein